MEFLDNVGLAHFWGKVKASVSVAAEKAAEAKTKAVNIENSMYQPPAATTYQVTITPSTTLLGPITQATVGEILGDEVLATLTPSGTGIAGNLYDCVINGVTTGSYTRDSILSDILAGINSSAEAAVSVTGDGNTFTFTAKQTGAGVDIAFAEGLAAAIFDSAEADGESSSFADSYGIDWLREGRTEKLSFEFPGGFSESVAITKNDTIEDVANKLNENNIGENYGYTASCNKYTGQLEIINKAGKRIDFIIRDSYGDEREFDTEAAPPNPYTYGMDAVFTAIKVNGTIQKVIDKTVGISVPVKVSQLTNDSKFQTQAQVSEAIAAAAGDGSGDVYSTEETVIGTWIDGRKRYRKVLDLNVSFSTNGGMTTAHMSHNIDNIDTTCCFLHGYCAPSKGPESQQLPGILIMPQSSGYDVFACGLAITDTEVYMGGKALNGTNKPFSQCTITVEYCKTIDPAAINLSAALNTTVVEDITKE